jgi:hypothetical protein
MKQQSFSALLDRRRQERVSLDQGQTHSSSFQLKISVGKCLGAWEQRGRRGKAVFFVAHSLP